MEARDLTNRIFSSTPNLTNKDLSLIQPQESGILTALQITW